MARISVDNRGDIYAGEVSYTNWGRRVRAKGEQIDLARAQEPAEAGQSGLIAGKIAAIGL